MTYVRAARGFILFLSPSLVKAPHLSCTSSIKVFIYLSI